MLTEVGVAMEVAEVVDELFCVVDDIVVPTMYPNVNTATQSRIIS